MVLYKNDWVLHAGYIFARITQLFYDEIRLPIEGLKQASNKIQPNSTKCRPLEVLTSLFRTELTNFEIGYLIKLFFLKGLIVVNQKLLIFHCLIQKAEMIVRGYLHLLLIRETYTLIQKEGQSNV